MCAKLFGRLLSRQLLSVLGGLMLCTALPPQPVNAQINSDLSVHQLTERSLQHVSKAIYSLEEQQRLLTLLSLPEQQLIESWQSLTQKTQSLESALKAERQSFNEYKSWAEERFQNYNQQISLLKNSTKSLQDENEALRRSNTAQAAELKTYRFIKRAALPTVVIVAASAYLIGSR